MVASLLSIGQSAALLAKSWATAKFEIAKIQSMCLQRQLAVKTILIPLKVKNEKILKNIQPHLKTIFALWTEVKRERNLNAKWPHSLNTGRIAPIFRFLSSPWATPNLAPSTKWLGLPGQKCPILSTDGSLDGWIAGRTPFEQLFY